MFGATLPEGQLGGSMGRNREHCCEPDALDLIVGLIGPVIVQVVEQGRRVQVVLVRTVPPLRRIP